MKASEFVMRLKALQPSRRDLHALGFSGPALEQLIRSYECIPTHQSGADNPILELCSSYDVSSVEIGYVHLMNVRKPYEDPVQFGYIEDDPLLLVPSSDFIWVADHSRKSHVVWECAATSHGFLEALLTISQVSTRL